MSEAQFDEYLEGSPNLSDRSKQMYRNQFRKFEEMQKNLLTQSQINIINFVDNTSYALNTKLAMYNVAVNVRKFYGKEVNKINNRKLQIADDYAQQKNADKCDKLAGLPTSKQLIAHENRLYLDGNWEGYIIVHLLRMLSLRNKDLDVVILPADRSKRDDKKQNYLVARKLNAQLVRNNYKTADKYGTKKNVIQSKRLLKAIKELVAERDLELGKDKVYLLSRKDGARLNEDSIAKRVRKHTFQGLSETDYNKIFVSELKELKDGMKKLKQISENRGTSLDVLLNEYHLDC